MSLADVVLAARSSEFITFEPLSRNVSRFARVFRVLLPTIVHEPASSKPRFELQSAHHAVQRGSLVNHPPFLRNFMLNFRASRFSLRARARARRFIFLVYPRPFSSLLRFRSFSLSLSLFRSRRSSGAARHPPLPLPLSLTLPPPAGGGVFLPFCF